MIRVLIAEDERPLREALADLIGNEPDLEVVAAVPDAVVAIEEARRAQPDVALVDVKMPGGGGPVAAREIRLTSPSTRVIALSAYEDRATVLQMLGSGAVGYLVKGAASTEIVEAVRRGARGQASMAAHTFADVIDTLLQQSRPQPAPAAAEELRADVSAGARPATSELEQLLDEQRSVLAYLVSTGEEERKRIADGIHDDSIQAMTAAGLRLQLLRRKLESPEQARLLDELEETIELSIDRLRRLLFELRPPALDQEGLPAAVELYLKAQGDDQTEVSVEDRLVSQPSPETRLVLYRITQEALTNVRKHAGASTTRVELAEAGGGFVLRVTDDGIGFSTGDLEAPRRLGLAAIRERAELAGGSVRVASTPDRGTSVEVWIPYGIQ